MVKFTVMIVPKKSTMAASMCHPVKVKVLIVFWLISWLPGH